MVFRKRGRLKRELRVYYNNNEVEIVSQFTYLGIVFTTWGSFKQTFEYLHVQALKSKFRLKFVINKCPCIIMSNFVFKPLLPKTILCV